MSDLTATAAELNEQVLTLDIADGSAEAVYYLISPHAGTITKIWTVTDGAVSTADITITAAIGATPVTDGVVTIATAGSGAGDIDSATPSAANVLTAGQAINFTVTGGGSGGSILLRGDAGVIVLPGGSVTARGGLSLPAPLPWSANYSYGAAGYVRLDAWGALPVILGTVAPAPTELELPYLRSLSQPTIGTTWTIDVFAPDTAWVYVAASLTPGTGIPTPWGPLGLDLATTAGIALTVPQPGHDPVANVQWPIPNVPALIGLSLWIQAFGGAPPAARAPHKHTRGGRAVTQRRGPRAHRS